MKLFSQHQVAHLAGVSQPTYRRGQGPREILVPPESPFVHYKAVLRIREDDALAWAEAIQQLPRYRHRRGV